MSIKRKSAVRKLFALSDLLVVFAVLVVFLVLFVYLRQDGTEKLYAEISVKGERVELIEFSQAEEAYTLDIEGVKLQISSEGVCFLSSPCNDEICVDRGVISRAGESAVCLPQRVSVRIISESEKASDVDAVAG